VSNDKQTLQQAWFRAEQNVLFSALDPEIRTQLMAESKVVALENGETLFLQGDDARYFFLVLEGRIKLNRVSVDGNEKIIEVLNPNGTFAEAVMFMEGSSYPVNAHAIGSTQVLGVSNQAYLDSIAGNPTCSKRLMGKMAEKLHFRLNEIETLTLQNARHRLVRFLLSLVSDLSVDQVTVTLPMAKRLIASRLAMQPETFSRIMHELKDREIVAVKGSEVQVLNLQQLKDFG